MRRQVQRWATVIVNHDEVIATGYNGAPRGRANCSDLGYCLRTKMEIPRGERMELCRSVHAEANAIICASRRDMIGAVLYLVGIEAADGSYTQNAVCCSMCKRLVINAGISQVVVRDDKEHFRVIDVSDWVADDESLRGVLGY